MFWEQKIQYGSLTDLGFRRQNNEDSLTVRILKDVESWKTHGHLFVVADGMGGHAVGELASKIAVDTVPHSYFKSTADQTPQEALKKAVLAANAAIYERAAANHEFQRMGTTCSSLVLGPHGAMVGQVGDSRVYRIRGERIDQLSRDHSLEWELREQTNGELDPSLYNRSKHVITRSLGPERVVEVDIEGPYPVFPGDTYVICSDGLTGHLNDDEIGMICRELPPGEACKFMVNLANLRGGSDNISVIVAEVDSKLPTTTDTSETDQEVKNTNELGTIWWIAIWLAGFLLTAGICLTMLQSATAAIVLTTLGGFSIVALLLLWFRKRNRENNANYPLSAEQKDQSSTIIWKPYRTASSRLSTDFLKQLDAITEELKRTAQQEKWQLKWERVELLMNEAHAACQKRNYTFALKNYSLLIEKFMIALKKHRKM